MSKISKTPDNKPVVFWFSDPVMPDETVMLSGADFAADSIVEMAIADKEDQLDWVSLAPIQVSEVCMKAVVPSDWQAGIYACRVRTGKVASSTVFLNAPDVWWKQGEGGVDATFAGDWLRIFGKCLDIDGGARVRLAGDGPEIEVLERGGFALRVQLPADLQAGEYGVEIHNGTGGDGGWKSAGSLTVRAAQPDNRPIISILEHGADPTGMKDCTLAIVQAIERAHGLRGGGIVFVPRGRYRIDGILRSGTWIDSPLILPENVSLRGEGANLSSLWWPSRASGPLPTLIECRRRCEIEDLAIYAQGPLNIIITGDSEVTLRRLIIRANPFYMANGITGRHARTALPGGENARARGGGSMISLWGENNRVLDCDLLGPSNAFDIRTGRGTIVAGNVIRGTGGHMLNFCSEMIYESNTFEGSPFAGGNNIALHFGGFISRHIYYAHNTTRHLYGGDHECLTFDGHGGIFFGRVADVTGDSFMPVEIDPGRPYQGTGKNFAGMAVYIIDGRGVGQYRFARERKPDGKLILDRPWDVLPDSSSLIAVGGFNGRHIVLGNTGQDVGTLVQLYPANCECFVVGNRGIRANNINCLSSSGTFLHVKDWSQLSRMEVSWRNQMLDNEVLAGNAWGGGKPAVISGQNFGNAEAYAPETVARAFRHATGFDADPDSDAVPEST
ncbi:MAG: hypothetical protein GX804_01220 [Lentisphaerae bacterium]|jgi:hypothetical protein|nr:hypothetical protein [Lentisphaerota bacterium]